MALPAWQLPIFEPPEQVLRLVTCTCMQTRSHIGLYDCAASHTTKKHVEWSPQAYRYQGEDYQKPLGCTPTRGELTKGLQRISIEVVQYGRVLFVPVICYAVPQLCLRLKESASPAMPSAWLL